MMLCVCLVEKQKANKSGQSKVTETNQLLLSNANQIPEFECTIKRDRKIII